MMAERGIIGKNATRGGRSKTERNGHYRGWGRLFGGSSQGHQLWQHSQANRRWVKPLMSFSVLSENFWMMMEWMMELKECLLWILADGEIPLSSSPQKRPLYRPNPSKPPLRQSMAAPISSRYLHQENQGLCNTCSRVKL